MQPISRRSRSSRLALHGTVAVFCAALLVPGNAWLLAQQVPSAAGMAPEQGAMLPADQLDSLVAPIALYPDALLAQTLAASTYPLEIIQLQQFLAKNPKLKDKALADAVAKQPWDPSVQSMAAFPDVVKRLADDVQWTTDLGNAFLAQQSDVMNSVQRMRKKAKDKGTLTTNEQMVVETKVIEQKTIIIVESANPEVIYVPVYSPTVVYPPPVYPYPPIYYPPYYGGAAFLTFTAGVMVGAAIWGGAWGHCGWGHNDININVNNNFNRNNINTGNIGSGNRGGGNNWQHNSQHRGGTPYANKSTANKYGGTARGDSLSSRQANAQKQARGGASASQQGRGSTGGGASASQQGRGGTSGGASASQQGRTSASSPSSGGSSRGASASSSSKGGGGFGGGSGGYSGSSARASSSRGASSFSGGGGRRR